jgi:hypothetical protein
VLPRQDGRCVGHRGYLSVDNVPPDRRSTHEADVEALTSAGDVREQ